MDAFLSYSSADKKIANGLREELTRRGLSVWSNTGEAATDWRHVVEDAIRSASDILVLVGPRDRSDEAQQFTWRAALETVWQDPSKRIIPVLLKGAQLPNFVRSGSTGELQAVRVENPRDLRGAAEAILEVIHQQQQRGATARNARSAFSFSVGSEPEKERLDRLDEVAAAAESLKE